MEKNTVLAIVLSSIVLIGFMFIQQAFFPAPEPLPVTETEQAPQADGGLVSTKAYENTGAATGSVIEEPDDQITEQTYVIDNGVVRATFTNRGGDIISYELLQHQDGKALVQMADNVSRSNRAFSLAFGGASVPIVNDLFSVRQIDDKTIGFYKKFNVTNADGTVSSFTMVKQYTFKPDDYLFQLDIIIDGEDGMKGLDFNNAGYTLRTPPQIGPHYDADNRYESRTFMSYTKDKRKKQLLNPGQTKVYDEHFKWTGVAGKYFTVLGAPYNVPVEQAEYSTLVEVNDYANAQVLITRSPVIQQKTHDTYYFYIGPRTESSLVIYNSSADNPWKLADMRFNDSMESSGFLSWLETALKWIMELFYKLIPNWGVSIILMTILTKIILFPLTKKSMTGTLKMQELQPKMKEIQDKYKANPEKMNMEMAKLYKETGYNPLSGCLPLLIQFPLIIAMYNLFNNYFEFRGAMFIPGWIPDLSVPDTVYTFPFNIPFLGNQLHLLPIIYVISQLLFGKVTQAPGATPQNGSMKFMMYGMPLIFFFIFYKAPSGLLLYWTVSNLLTLVQQVVLNRYLHSKKKEMAVQESKKPELKLVKKTNGKKK